jgi:hypothetical protein
MVCIQKPGRFAEQAAEHFQGLAEHTPGLKVRIFSAELLMNDDTVIRACDQHSVCNRFKDGLRAAGILLFAAEHAAQSFRLVTDQLVEMRVVDRHRHLSGNGFDQVQHFGTEEVWLAVEDHQDTDHILGHQQGHDNGAAMLA